MAKNEIQTRRLRIYVRRSEENLIDINDDSLALRNSDPNVHANPGEGITAIKTKKGIKFDLQHLSMVSHYVDSFKFDSQDQIMSANNSYSHSNNDS